MRKDKFFVLVCLTLSALLMSVPWLVPHCGFFALFGLVPMLVAEHVATEYKIRRFGLWLYLSLVLWNAITTWWVANATVGGAIFAILANSAQMVLLWWPFRLFKKRVAGILPYFFLAVLWIAWEKWYLQSAQISWPWLVLGNAFAQSTHCIQWYEWTGSLGGSLWVWLSNIGIFWLLRWCLEGRWKAIRRPLRLGVLAGTLAVVGLPVATSLHLYHHYEERSEGSIPVIIGQPNFDPYEKFTSKTQTEQTETLLELYESALEPGWKGLLIAPETFTGDVFLNDIPAGPTFRRFQSFLRQHPGANLLFGASTYRTYSQRSAPSILARKWGDGWMESHNSAIMTDTSGRADVFHKSKLVVGTELTPYPKFFVPIDDKLGGLMGRCIGQEHISCVRYLDYGEAEPECTMIGVPVCYESVYGEYCTGYVKTGAKALAVITNDAWWGDTPGYRQHFSYSCLRAIETRRDIARCGNTGISAIIDQRGEVLSRTPWWQPAVFCGSVNLSSHQTFFVRHGDIIGGLSVVMVLLFAILWMVLAFLGRKIVLLRRD